MNTPTYNEARPVWRPRGDVETYVPQVSAAERAARARQAGAPPSQPPVTLQSARRIRRDAGPAAPARREREGAEQPAAAPSPRPAPPPRRGGRGVTQAIIDAFAGGPLTMSEVIAAMRGHATEGTVSGRVWKLRQRGVLVQDRKRGPYRLADAGRAR